MPNPPDDTVPVDYLRYSTLPVDEIEDAVNNALHIDIRAYIDQSGNVGGFCSEYIAYLGLWYQYRHGRAGNDYSCVAAGHIHVGQQTTVPDAAEVVEMILEVVKAVEIRLPDFWISHIGLRVRTKDQLSAASKDTVSFDISRDDKFVAFGNLNIVNFEDLQQGDETLYEGGSWDGTGTRPRSCWTGWAGFPCPILMLGSNGHGECRALSSCGCRAGGAGEGAAGCQSTTALCCTQEIGFRK